jgi:hypothetical protein
MSKKIIFTDEQIELIKKLYYENNTYLKIAQIIGTSQLLIKKMFNKSKY